MAKDSNRMLKRKFSVLMNELLDASGEKGYKKFIFFLILIDLVCFTTIMSDNLFGLNLGAYNEFAWILLFALGLIIVSNFKKIKAIKEEGFKSTNFTNLATFIIGVLALITAFLSLPFINLISPILNSIKGIIALIAIVYIVLEAWVIKS